MQCISIPECTQRLSHLTNLGGQHGQESQEGKESEERSEEDCEEDPQGRQEEEVNLAYENCRRLDAGTSHEPSGRFASRSRFQSVALVDERGCRRDIRSNGWIVFFEEFALYRKAVRQKKQVFFVRCGS